MLRVATWRLPRIHSKRNRLTKNDAKTLATRPMKRVTAKPLMGPVPNWKSRAAAIRPVVWVSRIVN